MSWGCSNLQLNFYSKSDHLNTHSVEVKSISPHFKKAIPKLLIQRNKPKCSLEAGGENECLESLET